jgi:ABC-type oligopeptide transport system substrate-binding subunit
MMKKASLAVAAFALLALAGCNKGNEDQLNAANMNGTESLDDLSNDAANVASEAQVLQNQAEQLNEEAKAVDNATGPKTPADENIEGM